MKPLIKLHNGALAQAMQKVKQNKRVLREGKKSTRRKITGYEQVQRDIVRAAS